MTTKAPREKRVSDILNAAVGEFVKKGYEGASMGAIAARAKLTKGGLYHHFRSKDEILIAANELFMEPIAAIQEAALMTPSALRGLRQYVRRSLRYWAQHERETVFVFLSLTKALTSRKLRLDYAQYYERMVGFFAVLLERAIEERSLVPHDTRARAVIIMSALDGALGYLVMSRKVSLTQLCRHFDQVLLQPLQPRASGKEKAARGTKKGKP